MVSSSRIAVSQQLSAKALNPFINFFPGQSAGLACCFLFKNPFDQDKRTFVLKELPDNTEGISIAYYCKYTEDDLLKKDETGFLFFPDYKGFNAALKKVLAQSFSRLETSLRELGFPGECYLTQNNGTLFT